MAGRVLYVKVKAQDLVSGMHGIPSEKELLTRMRPEAVVAVYLMSMRAEYFPRYSR